MVRRAGRRRLLASLLLPAVLWSAVPAVQWCSLRWDQICPRLVVRCVEAMQRSIAACGVGSAACPLESMATAGDACGDDGTTCPLATRVDEVEACGADATCPLAAESDPADPCAVEACPLSAEAKAPFAAAGGCNSAGETSTAPHGRAYCLGDPTGGLGLRNHDPKLTPPALLATIATLVEVEAPAPRATWMRPEATARPPTRAWKPVPPARAPPLQG